MRTITQARKAAKALTGEAIGVVFLGRWAILPITIDLFLLWGLLIPHWSVASLQGA